MKDCAEPLAHEGAPADTWSVDFVEHLRTVHFALVALSAGLFILVLTTTDSRIARALSQATQIADEAQPYSQSFEWREVQTVLLSHAQRFLPAALQLSILSDGLAFNTTLDVTNESLSNFEVWRFPNDPLDQVPHTLAAFRDWWNGLHRGLPVRVPVSAPFGCRAFVVKSDPTQIRLGKPDETRESAECQMKWMETPTAIKVAEPIAARFVATTGPELLPQLGPTSRYSETDGAFLTGSFTQRSLSQPEVIYEVRIAVKTLVKTVQVQETGLKDHVSNWEPGKFEETFAELNSVAVSENLFDIPLNDVKARIAGLPHGDQSVEALGLKVPTDQIARWGLGFVLAVQFYFWLHLHEFNRKVSSTSPGKDVAWIGVYKSWPAFAAILASACIVPIVTLSILTYRLPRSLPNGGNTYVAWAISALLEILGCALALGTAERFWRLRINLQDHGSH